MCELRDTAGVGRNPWPQIRALLRNRSRNSRSLHLTFVVDDHTGIVLEIYKCPILPAKWLPLPYDHCRHHYNNRHTSKIFETMMFNRKSSLQALSDSSTQLIYY